MKNNFEGYTGRLLEGELLMPLLGTWKGEGYFTEERSYDWVKKNQPWNPSDPSNKMANDLHYLVGEKLGLEDFNDLKLYSALGSPLDLYFGVDAFFEYGDAKITLDITANPHKTEHKADYIIHEDLLTDVGRQAASKVIADQLKKDLAHQNLQHNI